jgi:hypothetical protein
VDRDGKVLASLPKIWGGITKGEPETLPGGLPNAAFAMTTGLQSATDAHPRFVHRFYQNQMD